MKRHSWGKVEINDFTEQQECKNCDLIRFDALGNWMYTYEKVSTINPFPDLVENEGCCGIKTQKTQEEKDLDELVDNVQEFNLCRKLNFEWEKIQYIVNGIYEGKRKKHAIAKYKNIFDNKEIFILRYEEFLKEENERQANN